MSVETAARLTTWIVLVGIAIGDLELLTNPAPLRNGGFYSWDVLRTTRRWTMDGGRRSRLLDRLFTYPNVVVLFAVQLAATAAAAVATERGRWWCAAALGVVLAVNMLFHLRNQYGMDGSDQMQTVVVAALVVFYVSPTALGREVALVFIAAQAVLSYFTAGFAKLISPVWRGGTAVKDILKTRTYGSRVLGEVVAEHALLSPALCWATITFECFMPLLVFAGPKPALFFIASGVLFHFGIASSMGLNLFFWSFVATYPSLYYLATLVHPG